jgi:small subunit ribosomal protein S16
MAIRIRLARRGRKKLALYDIVVANQRAPRDGRFLEKVGNYNPNMKPAAVNLHEEKILKWLLNGADPSETVRSILSSQGILLRKHLQVGIKKGAITQGEADKRFTAWQAVKMQKNQKFVSLSLQHAQAHQEQPLTAPTLTANSKPSEATQTDKGAQHSPPNG